MNYQEWIRDELTGIRMSDELPDMNEWCITKHEWMMSYQACEWVMNYKGWMRDELTSMN